ncbi:sigma-70 family RNA polymerase sigma factor [Chloracidobacterium sp. MS 40/45]|jgi:RNA polymerase sigma-70 factor (ECF subfamily)|uniref:RNA polymerase sigma factor n=1 Tax=Chloracidobacterium TaxID=458032 RepID=UPI0007399EB9|nr:MULTISPECIES: sigma-70 family RNA polymerase sigma factor [Chloracidobacterium]QUV99644.1 sigma-70 family RNA polymerase sigma factor [Chloracidobacterium sp. MS 40/45]
MSHLMSSALTYPVPSEIHRVVTVDAASDHELIAAVQAGDEQAFQEIVRRYRTPITNFIFRMLDDYDRAVELAQETFLRVYANVARYRATFHFSTYIYRIATNLAISELRQRRRRKLVSLFTPWARHEDEEETPLDIPDERPLQDADLIERERRAAVGRAIQTLPEKYRAALVLRDVEGLSYDEIAGILNISEGTVKSRINRARGLLRDKLRAYL